MGQDDSAPYRFVNFLEATIDFDMSGRQIVGTSFTAASGLYRNPSYLGIHSDPFRIIRACSIAKDFVVFIQTVGCRTVSPEVIGEAVGSVVGGWVSPSVGPIMGDRVGRKVAHSYGYPPIWTSVALTIHCDGRSAGKVLSQSLFPSMTFYADAGTFGKIEKVEPTQGRQAATQAFKPTQRDHTAVSQPSLQQFAVYTGSDVYRMAGLAYDARSNLDRWGEDGKGWGGIGMRHPHGPTEGNPWGFDKSDLE
jgi:hypothetical protein